MSTAFLTVNLTASREEVFAYLAALDHLPQWAAGFVTGLERAGAWWRTRTLSGDSYVTLAAHAGTGVIDLLLGEQPDEMELIPLRVLTRPHGCAVTATFFRRAGVPEELHEWERQAFGAALRGLTGRFGGGHLEMPPERRGGIYPSLVTAKFCETWDFYTTHFGYRTVCEMNGYVHLEQPGGSCLGIMREESFDELPELVSATDGRGMWLNVEVADVDAVHARLVAAGVEIVAAPVDRPWDRRHCFVRDPNGVIISLSHVLPVASPGGESCPAAS